jgi:serine/threonine-protein kinase RsbW
LSSLEQLPGLLDDTTAAMERAGYGLADRFAVRMALEEAVVNAVKHGHGYDPGKQVRIWWLLGASSVKFVVHDEGPGFDVTQVPDPRSPEYQERPSGRGLLLIGAFMSWLRFNRRGNCLAMCRLRSNGDNCIAIRP